MQEAGSPLEPLLAPNQQQPADTQLHAHGEPDPGKPPFIYQQDRKR